MSKSWKPEVKTVPDDKWYGNSLAFATEKEAAHSAKDLFTCRRRRADGAVANTTKPQMSRASVGMQQNARSGRRGSSGVVPASIAEPQ